MRFGVFGIAAALAWLWAMGAAAQDLCADPAKTCAAELSASCQASLAKLERLGAGAVPAAEDVTALAACSAEFEAYRACVARAARECGPGERVEIHEHPSVTIAGGVACRATTEFARPYCGNMPTPFAMLYAQHTPVTFKDAIIEIWRIDGGAPSEKLDLGAVDRRAAAQLRLPLPTDWEASFAVCAIYEHPKVGGRFVMVRGAGFTPGLRTSGPGIEMQTYDGVELYSPLIRRAGAGESCEAAIRDFAAAAG